MTALPSCYLRLKERGKNPASDDAGFFLLHEEQGVKGESLVFIPDSAYNYFMLTIEQTVTISPDRRIFFDLPPELPVGRAKVELTFTQLADTPQTGNREKIRLTKSMIDEMLHGKDLRSLTGLLHTEMSAEEIRAERLKKHDHPN